VTGRSIARQTSRLILNMRKPLVHSNLASQEESRLLLCRGKAREKREVYHLNESSVQSRRSGVVSTAGLSLSRNGGDIYLEKNDGQDHRPARAHR
jgi:hypothetical protein